MPPKQSKADVAKKQKVVEDKTFGLKNKNKSKAVQKYVQNLKSSVQPRTDPKQDAKVLFLIIIIIPYSFILMKYYIIQMGFLLSPCLDKQLVMITAYV